MAVVGVVAVVLVTVAVLIANPAAVNGTSASQAGASAAVQATGETTDVTVTIEGMAFNPSTIELPAGNELVVTLVNNGDQRHDLVLATGASLEQVAPGEQVTGSLGVITESTDGWCSLTGHRQMGMVLTVTVTGSASSTESSDADADADADTDADAPSAAELQEYADTVAASSAELEPLTDETEHYYTFTVTEQLDAVTGELSPVRLCMAESETPSTSPWLTTAPWGTP